MNMKNLQATIEVRKGKGLQADLNIINNGRKPVLIHNPGRYQPTEGWEFSREAYNVAVLISFHFLVMKLVAQDGTPVEPRNIVTRADHDVELPLELKPSAQLTISIPLDEFFDLKRGLNYSLELTYGDRNLAVHAKGQFQCP